MEDLPKIPQCVVDLGFEPQSELESHVLPTLSHWSSEGQHREEVNHGGRGGGCQRAREN